jgi:N5-(cytidine 5'-diphosphoramidyl)-L-glutamine hydrolase
MRDNILIGVTQRVDKDNFREEWRDALDQRLIKWVIESGFVPIPIPNTMVDIKLSNKRQPVLDNWISELGIDALILSGGNDIGEVPQRDLTEQYLLKWSEKNRKPVLGICRGMQMMGVYAGGSLIKVDGHVRTYHKLQTHNDFEKSFPKSVNSYHNLALKDCPDMFQILAKSEDGNLEAMRHKDLPWEAWMWHPEREKVFTRNNQERFRKLVNNEK